MTDRWYQKYIVTAGRKDLKSNLQYRKQLREEAAKNGALRDMLLSACAEDFLFWVNAFCFVHEPRPRWDSQGRMLPKTIPFITWPHQDPIIKAALEALGRRDIGLNKSRGEGVSWYFLLMALWQWRFEPYGVNIGLVSSKMEKADTAGNLDSLMAKIVWEMAHLPPWMSGTKARSISDPGDWCYNATDHSMVWRPTNAQINAFAATGGTGRGGRYTWFLADELGEWEEGPARQLMESTGPATDSRVVVSTPAGPTGAYYRFIHTPSNALRLVSHWSENISKNRGLYTMVKGKPIAVSNDNPLPHNYNPPTREVAEMFERLRNKGFDLKTGVRSPWYDEQCDRADATPQYIAKELDLNFGGSVDKVFHHEFFEVVESTVKAPILRGQFYANTESPDWDFERVNDGQFNLWCELDVRNQPPRSEYGVSCDLAVGGGGSHSSNSVLTVIDFVTKEQVLEFASNVIKPADFADIAIGVCHWFYGAYLSWENQGPGIGFGDRVNERGYGNVYNRRVKWKSTVNKTVTEIGWLTTTESKEALFEGLRAAVKRRELIIRSAALAEELHQYIRDTSGKIEHAGKRIATGSGAGLAHGDRVIAIGIGVQAAKDRPQRIRRLEDWSPEGQPPPGTMAYREWLSAQEDNVEEWDDRTTYDLTRPKYARLR